MALHDGNQNTKPTKDYSPKGNIAIKMLPMGEIWNDSIPSIYLALFTWLAPFKEGRAALKDFAAKADPIFAQQNYLCFVVIQPVNKIVSHLLDISVLEKVIKYDAKESNSTSASWRR